MSKEHVVRKAQKKRRRRRQDYFREHHGDIHVERPEPPSLEKMFDKITKGVKH